MCLNTLHVISVFGSYQLFTVAAAKHECCATGNLLVLSCVMGFCYGFVVFAVPLEPRHCILHMHPRLGHLCFLRQLTVTEQSVRRQLFQPLQLRLLASVGLRGRGASSWMP